MANIQLGRIVAATGLRGEVVVVHTLGKASTFKDVPALLVEVRKGELIPYFLEAARTKNAEETVVKLEKIDTPEQAKLLTRRAVWITEADFERLVAKNAPAAMVGYTLLHLSEPVGEIVSVLEQPHQLLCTVAVQDKEALVPVHADNLKKIDHKARTVSVAIPEGLLDLYLA